MIRDQDDRRQWVQKGHQGLTAKAGFFYSSDGLVASTDPGWAILLGGPTDKRPK